jgi:hypothetical protein
MNCQTTRYPKGQSGLRVSPEQEVAIWMYADRVRWLGSSEPNALLPPSTRPLLPNKRILPGDQVGALMPG